eukprot:6176668-Pleurochrysis_carterae.AAC.1
MFPSPNSYVAPRVPPPPPAHSEYGSYVWILFTIPVAILPNLMMKSVARYWNRYWASEVYRPARHGRSLADVTVHAFLEGNTWKNYFSEEERNDRLRKLTQLSRTERWKRHFRVFMSGVVKFCRNWCSYDELCGFRQRKSSTATSSEASPVPRNTHAPDTELAMHNIVDPQPVFVEVINEKPSDTAGPREMNSVGEVSSAGVPSLAECACAHDSGRSKQGSAGLRVAEHAAQPKVKFAVGSQEKSRGSPDEWHQSKSVLELQRWRARARR